LEELLASVKESYDHAVRTTARYAIEMEPGETAAFREHLHNLQEQVSIATEPKDWKGVQAGFRGELRDYRDKAATQLARLRAEIESAGEAVHLFAQSVTTIDSDHETQIRGALGQLDVIAQAVTVEALQTGIRSAAQIIVESMETMQRRHQVAMVQLRDEIRLLHKQIDAERNAHLLDPGTGVWNRQTLDSHIADLLKQDQPFCILLVCIRNLPRLGIRYSRTIIEGTLKALLQRLRTLLDEGTLIGRWDEQNFAAILEIEPAAAMGISRNASKNLAGSYSVQENGFSRRVSLQAVAGTIDRAAGSDEASFREKLSRMSQALAGE
jgi:GGDEF domain-containing protein